MQTPLSIFFGPPFQKDVRASGRRKGTYWLRFLYAAGLLGIVTVVFTGMQWEIRTDSVVERLQAMQELAPLLSMVIIWFQFPVLALCAPILTAPVVCEEKRARTLSTLLTTPLTAAQIALGALSGRIVQLVILGLLASPLLLAVRVFGGMDAEVVLAAACLSICVAILGASLGLMYSVWHKRAATAALFGIFTLALSMGGPIAGYGMYVLWIQDQGGTIEFQPAILVTCAPGALLAVCLGSVGGFPKLGLSPTNIWLLSCAYNLALAGLVCLYSVGALRRVMLREASRDAGAEPKKLSRKERRRLAAESAGQAGPARAEVLAVRDRLVGDRPVLWREVRQASFGSRRRFIIALVVTALLLAPLYVFIGMDRDELHGTIIMIGAFAILLQAVFLTTGGVSTEREARTWEVLLATPLSGAQIILAKFLGAIRRQWFVPAVIAAHCAIAIILGFLHPAVTLHIVLIWSGPIALLSATGVAASLFFRKGVTASVINLMLAISIWGLIWVLAGATIWLMQVAGAYDNDVAQSVFEFCYKINPLTMTFTAADGVFRLNGNSFTSPSYDLADSRVSFAAFTWNVVVFWAGYMLASAAVLGAAVASFRRLSGRSS